MPSTRRQPNNKPRTQAKKLSTSGKQPFLTEDAEVALHHFRSIVEQTPEDDLDPWTGDALIVRLNATRAVDALRPHEARLREALPLLRFDDILELPALCLALAFAADRVFVPASRKEIQARQLRVRPLRSQALRVLEVLAERGLVLADRVKAIRANSGPIDEARDAVAIPALFRDFADAVADRHPFTQEELRQLSDDGNWLLTQLIPAGAPAGKSARNPDAVLRDQLWTEVQRRYDEIYKAGVEIWGRRKVDTHIPALMSRATATPPRSATSGEAAPAASPPAATTPASPPPAITNPVTPPSSDTTPAAPPPAAMPPAAAQPAGR
ncbi:hypothetical protein [Sorangium sp. So ce124]|uniref:hypothetical protein n=1 Tax=Sorangium sp. So ce124 TaxID=3133280 RepID=UPI003F60AC95